MVYSIWLRYHFHIFAQYKCEVVCRLQHRGIEMNDNFYKNMEYSFYLMLFFLSFPRTSEKLCVDGSTEVETCVLCQGALDTRVPLSSALNSTTFSASLSQKPRPLVASDCGTSTEGCCGEGDGSCQSSGNKR